MEEEDFKRLNSFMKKEDWNNLYKEIEIKLKNSTILVYQLLDIIKTCERELAKFPEVTAEGSEVGEAVKEVEDLIDQK